MQADLIVVGAGAAGLMAARTVASAGKKVVVLEARNRIGGRTHTISGTGFLQPVETGAEFVHGNLEVTLQLLKEAGLKTVPAEGDVWRSKEGRLFQQEDFIEDADAMMRALENQKKECSVGAFLETHFSESRYGDLKKSVQGYVEGYYAGTLEKASVLALKEDWQKEEEPQHRVQGGYSGLMQFLYQQCIAKGVLFQLSSPVKKIEWGFEKVAVTTAAGQQYTARKSIVTVPVSVLQSTGTAASIVFQPEPQLHLKAMQDLGYGGVIKTLIQFKTAFWKEAFHLNALGFLFSDEVIPTWWTQQPRPSTLLVGWCAGPRTAALQHESETELFQKAIQSLAHIFGMPAVEIEREIVAWHVCNWAADPFTLGGYSYITTTTRKALQLLTAPVENTIYFAGEALHDSIDAGTVEAALQSGKRVAAQALQSFTG